MRHDHRTWKQVVALFLCYLLSPLSLAVPQGAAQAAGQITGLVPTASRNGGPVKLKDDVHWNDVIKTERSGRARVSLTDGSILSIGSNSELKIVQHDAAAQQTQLELNYGKLRNRVVALTKPGAKYQVKTPNAVAGVVGTDFSISYNPQTGVTSISVYSGTVVVTGFGQTVTVQAGQTVTITQNGISPPQPTPPGIQQEDITDTTVDGGGGGGTAAGGHLLRNILIGLGVAVVSVAVGVSTTGSHGEPTTTPTNTYCPTCGDKPGQGK